MNLHLINLLTTLRKIKGNFYIFFLFLNSLIFQKNKKKLFLYSIKPWQLKSQFYYRRQIYQKKIIEENNDIKIINVDFSNSIILAILAYYLNIFYKKEKNSFSKLIKNIISKKILNLYEAIHYSRWDTFLRDLHSQKIEFLRLELNFEISLSSFDSLFIFLIRESYSSLKILIFDFLFSKNLVLKIKGIPRINVISIIIKPEKIPFLIYFCLSIKFGSTKKKSKSLLFLSKSICLKLSLTI